MPLVRGHYPVTNPEWLLDGSPSGMLRKNLARHDVTANLSALTTQVMLSVALPLEDGDVVTSLTFVSGNTAAGTPTNWWFALYDDSSTPALLSQTADQTTAAWAANTAQTLALETAYQVERSGIYYAAVMVKATSVPTLAGKALQHAAVSGAMVSGQAVMAQTSGAALTDTAPATITSATTVADVPLVIAT